VLRKPPFTLSEKGWGEFDMKIILYFTDKSVLPFTLYHDLNFKKSHYEVPHKLVRINYKNFNYFLQNNSNNILI
jgi:transcription initiation factor TFIID/TFIIF subunit